MSSTSMNVFEGEDVELYCDVRGNPEPLVRWIRNDGVDLNFLDFLIDPFYLKNER